VGALSSRAVDKSKRRRALSTPASGNGYRPVGYHREVYLREVYLREVYLDHDPDKADHGVTELQVAVVKP